MNAIDSQRALLDSLMGQSRNNQDDDDAEKIRWRDDEVCKNHLVGFCPYNLFTYTKSDLGPCDKIHSDQFRREFQQQKDSRKKRYERRYLTLLEDIVRNCDRKIDRARDRIRLEIDMHADKEENLTSMQQERIDRIDDKINRYTKEMEDLGNKGMVEEAQELLLKVEELQKEKETLRGVTVGKNDFQNLTVCETCGALMMNMQDESRVDHHLRGKTHQGYQMIRDKLEELLNSSDSRKRSSRSPRYSRSRSHSRDRSSRRAGSSR